MRNNKYNKPRRILSIDLFRGFLLVIMVMEHFLLYFGNESVQEKWFYCLLNDGIAGWGAGGFLIMTGMSQALSSDRLGSTSNRFLLKKALFRGGYIFVVGLVMLILAFGPDDLWRWDILTIIGFATILLYFCRFLPSWLLILLVLCIVFVSPLARELPVSDFKWNVEFIETPFISGYFPGMFVDPVNEPEFYWRFDHIIKGFFLWGEFPIFPWIAFPLLGFVIGRRIVNKKIQSDLSFIFPVSICLIIVGFVIAFLGRNSAFDTVLYDYISPFCFYPVSFSMNVYQIGMTLAVFCILYHVYDVRYNEKNQPGFLVRILKRTSNFSLTFYFIHYLILGWSSKLFFFVNGESLFDKLDLSDAMIFSVIVLVLMQILIYYWEQANSKYSLEWFMTRITQKIVPYY